MNRTTKPLTSPNSDLNKDLIIFAITPDTLILMHDHKTPLATLIEGNNRHGLLCEASVKCFDALHSVCRLARKTGIPFVTYIEGTKIIFK